MFDMLKENSVFIYKDHKENISNNYVSILVTSTSSVTIVYNEVVANIKCHILFTF